MGVRDCFEDVSVKQGVCEMQCEEVMCVWCRDEKGVLVCCKGVS